MKEAPNKYGAIMMTLRSPKGVICKLKWDFLIFLEEVKKERDTKANKGVELGSVNDVVGVGRGGETSQSPLTN